MNFVRTSIAALGAIALSSTAVLAADPPAAYVPSAIDYFYVELEGGYVWADGAEERFASSVLQPDGGWTGTATLGHESIDGGIIGGYIDRAELWFTYADLGDDSNFDITRNSPTNYVVDRDFWEVGTRFQHYFDQSAQNKIMVGFEPFIGMFNDDIVVTLPARARNSGLDTFFYGAMLSLESEYHLAPSTILMARAAAGLYGADAEFDLTAGEQYEDSFVGFRGQAALGITQILSETVSFGVVGRLDYFSDVGVFNRNTTFLGDIVTSDDHISLSIGATLNFKIGGVYN